MSIRFELLSTFFFRVFFFKSFILRSQYPHARAMLHLKLPVVKACGETSPYRKRNRIWRKMVVTSP